MKDIITKRPEGMSYSRYRKVRTEQTKALRRRRKRGVIEYLAVEIFKKRGEDSWTRRTYPPAIKNYNKWGEVVYKPMDSLETRIKIREKAESKAKKKTKKKIRV